MAWYEECFYRPVDVGGTLFSRQNKQKNIVKPDYLFIYVYMYIYIVLLPESKTWWIYVWGRIVLRKCLRYGRLNGLMWKYMINQYKSCVFLHLQDGFRRALAIPALDGLHFDSSTHAWDVTILQCGPWSEMIIIGLILFFQIFDLWVIFCSSPKQWLVGGLVAIFLFSH